MAVTKGTISMAPPMPSRPAMKPVAVPRTRSSRVRRAKSVGMRCRPIVAEATRDGGARKRRLQLPPDRQPEPKFRWARSTWRWDHLTRDVHAHQVCSKPLLREHWFKDI